MENMKRHMDSYDMNYQTVGPKVCRYFLQGRRYKGDTCIFAQKKSKQSPVFLLVEMYLDANILLMEPVVSTTKVLEYSKENKITETNKDTKKTIDKKEIGVILWRNVIEFRIVHLSMWMRIFPSSTKLSNLQ